MTLFFSLLLLGLAVPAVAACAYLLLLTLLSGGRNPPHLLSRDLRFDIVIPAHDEAVTIDHAIASVATLDWPRDKFRILVIADNCTDTTAALARAAGAQVIERHDASRRGKGHALACAFAASRDAGWAEAVVVIDADTRVSANLLRSLASRINRPDMALQVHYGVLNVGASWRTRLLAIALGAFHRVRSRARERMRLSCGLRGNGWCITHDLLRQVPFAAHSLAEDVEYGIALGMAGHRVHYVDEAHVAALMVPGGRASRSQRRRWEAGRFLLVRSMLGPLLHGMRGRHALLRADLAIDLLVPPLSYVLLNVVALLTAAAALMSRAPVATAGFWLGAACLLCIVLYVLRGWQLSGTGVSGLISLACAPFFILWKTALAVTHRTAGEWVRTRRENP